MHNTGVSYVGCQHYNNSDLTFNIAFSHACLIFNYADANYLSAVMERGKVILLISASIKIIRSQDHNQPSFCTIITLISEKNNPRC